MKLVSLIILLGVAAACAEPTRAGTYQCTEQKAWPVISAAGDTTWVSNRNQSLCWQTTFGTAGQP